ncbi:3-oxo-isoapionate kinase [Methylobacterium crusticola]|uniref:3-oxo-isoapionate kinase n=1 Tax=Methylobacterium crusticola TaxID=1697972 RepID=A0ABQ4R9M8_9HYPH|nr:four-carbon acid sugar kinase family protein [Methylobacterium crusticola]GJD53479.1 3-oxo-isoapionate kinase [Methylobacterium crusticola]
MTGPPGAPRLVFYGDDFTGSTDALEVLAFAGLRTALFLAPPTPATLARFPALDAIGVAGDSRGMGTPDLEAAMPGILEALRDVGAAIVHYKTCSTFDSSPETGSIGRVIAIARGIFRNPSTPIVGGTPALARYCLFGNLFARSGTDGAVHRIDRHPIMSVHPVTPMREGDLARHIAAQAPLAIASLGYPDLERGAAAAREAFAALAARGPDAILIDAGSEAHLTEVGGLLLDAAERAGPLFVVGGSGVESALTQWWGRGAPAAAPEAFARFAPVDRLLAVSGSASRLTAAQIDGAVAAGFVGVPVDARALLTDEAAAGALADAACGSLAAGRSVILHTVRGPDDPRIAALRAAFPGEDPSSTGRRLGRALGGVLAAVQARARLGRLVVAGGDTASQAVQVLAPDALAVAARLAPGVPLCRMHAAGRALDGVEIALKGGQMGGADFFDRVRAGHSG